MKVVNLFGEIVDIEGQSVERAVGGDCDVKCLRAQEDRCTCRCGGRNHGFLMKTSRNQSLDGKRYIWLDHVKEIRELFDGYVCPSCGTSFKTADILGYEHPDGLYIEQYELKLWVFARCAKCGYDTAWWKLGRSLRSLPEGWDR